MSFFMVPPRFGWLEWAYLDLNQGPLPYQGSALTELSYRPHNSAQRYRTPHARNESGRGASVLTERDLETAEQLRREVVQMGADRGQRGHENHVDRRQHEGEPEQPAEPEVVLDVERATV